MEIFRAEKPTVNENTVMYRNPLGKKGGRNKIIAGALMLVIAAALIGVGVFYLLHDEVSLGVLLEVAGAAYIGLAVYYFIIGARLKIRPYAVIVDADNLILREKSEYLHLPLEKMRRLTVDCEGIDAYLCVNEQGLYDILIKGDTMYYTVDGKQNSLTSRNMRKVAFILNGIAIGGDKNVNWGERFEDVIGSVHAEIEGAESGLNKALDLTHSLADEKKESAPADGETSEKDGGEEESDGDKEQ